MRKSCILGILIAFFAGYACSVVGMENLRANGTNILLPLAPKDPRALLMGDYMVLEYTLNNAIWSAWDEMRATRPGDPSMAAAASGKAVMRLAPDSGELETGTPPVAVFARLDNGTPLQKDEILIAFKVHNLGVVTAAPAFYFAEGAERVYARAAFARIAVNRDGKTLLLALCDASGRDIRPAKPPEQEADI